MLTYLRLGDWRPRERTHCPGHRCFEDSPLVSWARVVWRLARRWTVHGRSGLCMASLNCAWPVWTVHGRSELCMAGLNCAWPVWTVHGRSELCMAGLNCAWPVWTVHGQSELCMASLNCDQTSLVHHYCNFANFWSSLFFDGQWFSRRLKDLLDFTCMIADKFSKDAKVKLTLFQKIGQKTFRRLRHRQFCLNWRWRRRRNVFCPIFWNKVNFTFASFENLSAMIFKLRCKVYGKVWSVSALVLQVLAPGHVIKLAFSICLLQCLHCTDEVHTGRSRKRVHCRLKLIKVSRDTFHCHENANFLFSVFRVVQGEAKTPKIMGCCRANFAFLPALKIGTFSGKWTWEWVVKTSLFVHLALYFLNQQ